MKIYKILIISYHLIRVYKMSFSQLEGGQDTYMASKVVPGMEKAEHFDIVFMNAANLSMESVKILNEAIADKKILFVTSKDTVTMGRLKAFNLKDNILIEEKPEDFDLMILNFNSLTNRYNGKGEQ